MKRWLCNTSSICCRIGVARVRYCSLKSGSGTRIASRIAASPSGATAKACLGYGVVDQTPSLPQDRAMSLIRGLFWLVLFVFFTFSFVVLFEYGTHDFTHCFTHE